MLWLKEFAVRFVEGVKYEVRDLSGKASVLVEQGGEMLEERCSNWPR